MDDDRRQPRPAPPTRFRRSCSADGSWRQLTSADDAGGWAALDPGLDGCGAPPFGYATDQLLTWAGPWVTFRSDGLVMDFTALGVREIGPLP